MHVPLPELGAEKVTTLTFEFPGEVSLTEPAVQPVVAAAGLVVWAVKPAKTEITAVRIAAAFTVLIRT